MKPYNRFLTAAAIATLAGVALSSCSNKEEDIFDESAAVRMDAAKTETKALLISAENGWELSYFSDNDWEEGHAILMKFHNDESVEMMGCNVWVANAFNYADMLTPQRETSLYQMISDDGPVLTFNTFNKVLHIFSEPYNLPSPAYNPNNVPFPNGPTEKGMGSNQSDVNEAGYGHNGDYEFVIISRTNDEISMRGKKTRINMRLRRLAPDVDWNKYFDQVNARSRNTFSSRFGDLKIIAAGHELHLSNLSNGVMHIVADDDDPLIETVKIPFLYTPDGIRLREPYKGYEDRLSDLAIQNFTFNDDGTLICTDQDVEFALNSSFAEVFGMASFAWTIKLSEGAGTIKTLFDEAVAEAAGITTYNGFNTLYFQYISSAKRHAITIRVNKTSSLGSLYGSYEYGDDNTIHMTFTGTEGDSNGLSRIKKLTKLQAVLDHLSAVTWRASTNSPMSPAQLTFTNTADPSEYFNVEVR